MSAEITKLLEDWRSGDKEALEKLMPLVMSELKRIAGRGLNRERRHHTLQTTELVNELFLKLLVGKSLTFQNRTHFFAVCAICIRQILTDYAKIRLRQKRGGTAEIVALDNIEIMDSRKSSEILALNEALEQLEKQDARKSKIVELRYYGGLTVDEVADVLGISKRTIEREWQMAKAWLGKELGKSN
jgi:RNA polymerase sigma factor (TIGR02999 family)